jgi:hypothetical protein
MQLRVHQAELKKNNRRTISELEKKVRCWKRK